MMGCGMTGADADDDDDRYDAGVTNADDRGANDAAREDVTYPWAGRATRRWQRTAIPSFVLADLMVNNSRLFLWLMYS